MRYCALEDGREDIPVIADVDIPLVMSSQLKELSKSIREAAKVSWDLRREGAVGDEGAPLPAEELSAQELFRAAVQTTPLSRRGHRRSCGYRGSAHSIGTASGSTTS